MTATTIATTTARMMNIIGSAAIVLASRGVTLLVGTLSPVRVGVVVSLVRFPSIGAWCSGMDVYSFNTLQCIFPGYACVVPVAVSSACIVSVAARDSEPERKKLENLA